MLALDLGVFHRKAHVVSFKESITWTAVWVVLALLFNLGVWHYYGGQKALEFFTGYLIEKSLSVDNVFVFALLFSYFAVPAQYQHKVLFWGILGGAHHAGHHDRTGGGADHQVHLDHLHLRRVPDSDGDQDGGEARGGDPPRAQPGGEVVQVADASDGGLSRG